MTLTLRDLVLAMAFLLAYPLAIGVTDWAAADGTDSVPPAVATSTARR